MRKTMSVLVIGSLVAIQASNAAVEPTDQPARVKEAEKFRQLGREALLDEDYDKALKNYTEAVRLDPNNKGGKTVPF